MATKKFITLLLILVGLTAFLTMPSPSFATTGGVKDLQDNLGAFGGQTGLGSPGDTDLKGKTANIINIVLGFLGVLAVIMIIIAGFKWMMAGGNEETVKQARDNIKNAVIGLLIVLASFIIVNFAVRQLGQATGAGGGGSGGTGNSGQGNTVSGPFSCVYSFAGCNNPLCVYVSTGPCPSTYPWPKCKSDGGALTGNLLNQLSGVCATACSGCSVL